MSAFLEYTPRTFTHNQLEASQRVSARDAIINMITKMQRCHTFTRPFFFKIKISLSFFFADCMLNAIIFRNRFFFHYQYQPNENVSVAKKKT